MQASSLKNTEARHSEAHPGFHSPALNLDANARLGNLYQEYGRMLAFFGKLLHNRHYVSGCDGNLSVRLDANCILTTPTGFSKGWMEPRDMVIVDLEGRRVHGLHAPSSEMPMHLTIYKGRPDVGAVVHAHPCTATGLASAGLDLTEPVCTELVLTLGEVPLAPYAPPGTPELGRVLEPFIAHYDAVLLQNHGVVAYAETLEQAYMHMETIEHSARILVATRLLGRCVPLSKREARRLRSVHSRAGFQSGKIAVHRQNHDLL